MMEFVSWDDEIPKYMDSHKKYHGSKAPIRTPTIFLGIHIGVTHLSHMLHGAGIFTNITF